MVPKRSRPAGLAHDFVDVVTKVRRE